MKPILIHIHAFYPEFLPELLEIPGRLGQIPHELWVTYPESDEKIVTLLNGCNHALPVENRGYDIAPFLSVLNKVNLDNYSYVLKLHTKRDMPGDAYIPPLPYNFGFSLWRKYLLNVGRKENMEISLQALEQDESLGMVADYRLIWNKEEPRLVPGVKEYLRKSGLEYKGTCHVIGTMFLCRASLLKPLQSLNLTPADFHPPDAMHTENLAHIMERYIGAIIVAQDARIQDVFTPLAKQARWRFHLLRLLNFIYLRKRKRDGSCIVKFCKIPIYRKKRA